MCSRVRNVIVVALVVLVTAGATTACSAEKPEPKTVEIIVPAGSRDRMRAGEYVVVMLAKLEMRVGDTLLIRNEDIAPHSVGPYVVQAGKEMKLTYGKAGKSEGFCAMSEGQNYEIVITDT